MFLIKMNFVCLPKFYAKVLKNKQFKKFLTKFLLFWVVGIVGKTQNTQLIVGYIFLY